MATLREPREGCPSPRTLSPLVPHGAREKITFCFTKSMASSPRRLSVFIQRNRVEQGRLREALARFRFDGVFPARYRAAISGRRRGPRASGKGRNRVALVE